MGLLSNLLGSEKEKQLFLLLNSVADYVAEASRTLVDLCQNPSRAEEYGKATKALEHECDMVVKKIFEEILDTTAMLPFHHDDIEGLIRNMDSILDCLWGAVKRITDLYFFPELEREKELLQIALILQNMSVNLKDIVSKMKKLGQMRDILRTAERFHGQENEIDDLCDAAIRRWHEEAQRDLGKLPARIAWKEVYERLDWAANRCVDVTDILKKIFRECS